MLNLDLDPEAVPISELGCFLLLYTQPVHLYKEVMQLRGAEHLWLASVRQALMTRKLLPA